ncbi:MAG: hypothetical protein EZS28_038540 [Streblomastix strix]|uniref:Uncharacterized protein n=1 Tax=Streblomastix strix TaxID=222440 RepID=A0A5J4U7G2_9EUKA|nr:MAG: hypothetical protein EZS28_038540 [Streblomastix strix]
MFVKNAANNAQHAKIKSVMNVYILESIVLCATNKYAKAYIVLDVTINGFVLIVASFNAKHAIRNGALITLTLVKHAANAKTRLARAAIASVTSA